jgi:hypothetical protein
MITNSPSSCIRYAPALTRNICAKDNILLQRSQEKHAWRQAKCLAVHRVQAPAVLASGEHALQGVVLAGGREEGTQVLVTAAAEDCGVQGCVICSGGGGGRVLDPIRIPCRTVEVCMSVHGVMEQPSSCPYT